jgi:ribose 5-phosphate isomerase B
MTLQDRIKTIHLAADHAGFERKEQIKLWLEEQGIAVIDHGAKVYEELDDFPDFISLAAAAVSVASEDTYGIIFGGSGQGEAMLANRFPNVRATAYYGGDLEIIRLSRAHNDANILSFGARFVSLEDTKKAIMVWLETPVLVDEKYRRRNQKIEAVTRQLNRNV